VVPALLFFLMAVMVLCLSPFDRTDSTDFWLAAALVLSGIQRGNQAFFFWWEIETIQDFVIFVLALTASLSLGAWLMAWRGWFKVDRPALFILLIRRLWAYAPHIPATRRTTI
jgi:hypothetical protein